MNVDGAVVASTQPQHNAAPYMYGMFFVGVPPAAGTTSQQTSQGKFTLRQR